MTFAAPLNGVRCQVLSSIVDLPNDTISPLFQEAIEATEEDILNSLFMATTISGGKGFVGEAIQLEWVAELLGGDYAKMIE